MLSGVWFPWLLALRRGNVGSSALVGWIHTGRQAVSLGLRLVPRRLYLGGWSSVQVVVSNFPHVVSRNIYATLTFIRVFNGVPNLIITCPTCNRLGGFTVRPNLVVYLVGSSVFHA